MAKVKIEDIVYHLDFEMKRALEDAVQEVLPKKPTSIVTSYLVRSSEQFIGNAAHGRLCLTSM